MHIESAATEIRLIVVSSKLGSESRYEFQFKTKTSGFTAGTESHLNRMGGGPRRLSGQDHQVDDAVLDRTADETEFVKPIAG